MVESKDKTHSFKAFITNLEMYNDGILFGEWLSFPASTKEIREVFERIKIGFKDEKECMNEEWFISDYDFFIDINDVSIFGEYESLNSLNKVALKLLELNDYELNKLNMILETREFIFSVEDLIEEIDDLDTYELHKSIMNEYDLGLHYSKNKYFYNSALNLLDYVDYKLLGKDVFSYEGGIFTEYGYIVKR